MNADLYTNVTLLTSDVEMALVDFLYPYVLKIQLDSVLLQSQIDV